MITNIHTSKLVVDADEEEVAVDARDRGAVMSATLGGVFCL